MLANQLNRIISQNQAELSALEGSLLSSARGKSVKSIFVTSSRAGEGKTTTAVAAAHALAARGKVLLVDANMRAPAVHTLFGLDRGPGLADVLLAKVQGAAILHSTEFANLTIALAGEAAPGASVSFDSEAFARELAGWKSAFDVVVLDGDSILSSSDAAALARLCDGVVLVAECEKTKWEVLELAKDKVQGVDGKVLGVILNKRRYYIPQGLYGKV
jgi:protein-tyrosine kinase